MDLKTKVVYRNRDMKKVSECEYSLVDYSDMFSLDLKRIITDIEDLVYLATNNQSKDDWDSNTMLAFNKIKRKILDKAGEIQRLPDTIFDAETELDTTSSFWDKLFNKDGE